MSAEESKGKIKVPLGLDFIPKPSEPNNNSDLFTAKLSEAMILHI